MASRSKSLRSRLWFKAANVFGAVALSDAIWARYISAVSSSGKLEASGWSVVVIALGAYVVVQYVEDRRLVLPAMVGAFIGTYLGT